MIINNYSSEWSARMRLLLAGWIGSLLFLVSIVPASHPQEMVWRTGQYGNFVFEYPSGTDKTVAYLERTCSLLEERIREDLPLEQLGQVRIILVTDLEQFLEKQPVGRIASPWIAGIAYPDRGLIILKSPRMLIGAQPAFERILFHEVAHVALHRALSCADTEHPPEEDRITRTQGRDPSRSPCIPYWLHEGYAIYIAREWSLDREITLGKAVLNDQLIPLGTLVAQFPVEEHVAALAYAQSADLVHFLRNEYGVSAFRRFIMEMGKDHRFGRALQEAFGITFPELEDTWMGHLKRRYHRFSIMGSVSLVWFVATLLFLAAYIRKKAITREIKKQWADQDGHDQMEM